MIHCEFYGTHYDAGFRYGAMLKKNGVVIQGSPTFAITDEMKRFASDCIPVYETFFPALLQELRGMADGQQTSFGLLCQIAFSIYCFAPDHHCTCLALSNETDLLFGRNSDFLVDLEELYMNCLYSLDHAFAFNGNTTSFIQMEDGMNEHGLAVGLTFLYPHIRKPGLNAGMLVRYLLEKCATVEEAVSALAALPRASAQTVTLVDRTGALAVVECNPQDFAVIHPKPGQRFVASTNHFHSEPLKKWNAPEGIDDWRSGERYATATGALEAYAADGSLDFVQRLLSGAYGFLCQYDRKTGADTVWSVVYDVKNRSVYRAEGNPSRTPFQQDGRPPFSP